MADMPDIDVRSDQFALVCSILEKHVPQYAVWAFGSRVKHSAKQFSDLDLAVITEKPLPMKTLAALSDDFSESDLPFKVDVVDWATTQKTFRTIIDAEHVVVRK